MIALLALVASVVAPTPAGQDRLIRCELGRVTNLKAATPADLGLQGRYVIMVLQPEGAVQHSGQPPRDPGAARLVMIDDPDKVLGATSVGTVYDKWPAKLEFLTRLPDGRRSFVTIGGIDAAGGTAIGSAGIVGADGETLLPGKFLQGPCTVAEQPGLAAGFARIKEKRP